MCLGGVQAEQRTRLEQQARQAQQQQAQHQAQHQAQQQAQQALPAAANQLRAEEEQEEEEQAEAGEQARQAAGRRPVAAAAEWDQFGGQVRRPLALHTCSCLFHTCSCLFHIGTVRGKLRNHSRYTLIIMPLQIKILIMPRGPLHIAGGRGRAAGL